MFGASHSHFWKYSPKPINYHVRRLLGVPNTDSPGRIVDVWGFIFLMEYMESLISINYSQVRDEVIGHTHICFGIFGLPFLRGGSGGSNQKNQATRCLLGSGHLKSLCLLVKRQIHQAENTCANSSSINSKSTETWIIIGRVITARMWFWGFCRHISMEIPPKYCNPDQKTLNSYDHLQPKHGHDLKQKMPHELCLETRCWPQAQTPQNANEIIWALPTFNWSKFSSTIWSASEGIPPPKINGSPPQNGPPHFQEISSEPNHFQGYPQKSWTNSGVYLKQNWANVTEQFPIEKWHISAS